MDMSKCSHTNHPQIPDPPPVTWTELTQDTPVLTTTPEVIEILTGVVKDLDTIIAAIQSDAPFNLTEMLRNVHTMKMAGQMMDLGLMAAVRTRGEKNDHPISAFIHDREQEAREAMNNMFGDVMNPEDLRRLMGMADDGDDD